MQVIISGKPWSIIPLLDVPVYRSITVPYPITERPEKEDGEGSAKCGLRAGAPKIGHFTDVLQDDPEVNQKLKKESAWSLTLECSSSSQSTLHLLVPLFVLGN